MRTESSGKTGICTKIVNLVKHQYALSGDAVWKQCTAPFHCTRIIWKSPNPSGSTNKWL